MSLYHDLCREVSGSCEHSYDIDAGGKTGKVELAAGQLALQEGSASHISNITELVGTLFVVHFGGFVSGHVPDERIWRARQCEQSDLTVHKLVAEVLLLEPVKIVA